MLKKKGLKTTGKKATLMKRLHMRGGEPDAPPPPAPALPAKKAEEEGQGQGEGEGGRRRRRRTRKFLGLY
jgi:hypothetical protein